MPDPAVAALIANPDDPEQRLVYADWLEQRGATEHAQLVRLGVERAAIGLARASFGANRGLRRREAGDNQRDETLRDAMGEISEAAHAQMTAALPALDGVDWSGDLIFGGVPEGVSVENVKTFVAAADVLAAAAPVRSLSLKRLDVRGARALVASGWLGRLRHLELHGADVTAKALEIIVGSEQARGLWSIELSLSRIKDAGAKLLAESPYLAGLEALILYGAQIGERGGVAIASSPYLQQLRGLNLEMNWLGAACGRAFLAEDIFPDVVHLNLFDNEPLENAGFVDRLRERWGERIEI
jgi:uncharacterized protein (TIGR02996 family)